MNALPLTYGLAPQEVELLHRPPAELLDLLQAGQVEAALLPIVNYFENPGLHLVPGLAIACRGPVKSVNLYLNSPKKNLQELRNIYLDPESRTSHALLKILLQERHGLKLDRLSFSSQGSGDHYDAQLLIGDKALAQNSTSLDLGQDWFEWQQCPFVFAAWMSFQAQSHDLNKTLQSSYKQGIQNIEQIVAQIDKPFPKSALKDYFTKNLHYTMGEAELDGIRRFYELSKPIQGYKHELHFNFVS